MKKFVKPISLIFIICLLFGAASLLYDYSIKRQVAQSASYTLTSSDNNVIVGVDSKFGGAITFLNDKRIDNNNIIDNSNSGTLFQTAIWTLPLSPPQTQLCHDYQKINGNCPDAIPYENPTQGGFYGDGLAGNPIGIRGFYGGWEAVDSNEYIIKQINKIELKSRMVNYNYAYTPRQYTTCGDTFESCEDKTPPAIDMTESNRELWETDFYIEQEVKFNSAVSDVIEINTTILYEGSSPITLQENQIPVLFVRGIFHPDPLYQGPYTRGAYRSGAQNVIFPLGSTRQSFAIGYDTTGSRTENWVAILKGGEDKGIGVAVFNYEPISNFGGNYFDYIIDSWPAIFARQPNLEKFLTSGVTNIVNNNWLIQPDGWIKVKTFIATGSVEEIRSKLLLAQDSNWTQYSTTEGYLDGASCDIFGGWARDSANPDARLDIRVDFTEENDPANIISKYVTANIERADLVVAFPPGNYAFSDFVTDDIKNKFVGEKIRIQAFALTSEGDKELDGSNQLFGPCEESPEENPENSTNSNVSGWAWSSNIGWISFGGDGYGVNMDADGNLSGYAWSENIGWISFNEDDTGAPPLGDPCADTTCIAKIEKPKDLGKKDVDVKGWARGLAHGDGWDGWIRFDHGKDDEVYIDINGEFRGRAWGSDVIGWITFNDVDDDESYSFTCETENGDICQDNEFCPLSSGEILDVIGTSSCCSVECVLKLCAEQGEDICQVNEYCPGDIISVRDTEDCCSVACEIIFIEPTLEDCLDDCAGAFLSCNGNCPGGPGGEECIEDCEIEETFCKQDCEYLYCGNCVEDSGGSSYPFFDEECDDCNASNTDACLNYCVDASCGDGYVLSGSGAEQCDDANSSNTDACLNTCVSATCGDGYVQSGVEECDDANNTNGDGCSAVCTIEHTLETCLDDCEDDRVSCTAGCKWWQVGCFEDCWDEYFDCETDCANLYCGNCAIDSGEQCDDCNAINTDACLTTCRNARCGDGYVLSGSGAEQCDDANSSNTDACLNTCVSATCGDGYVQSGVEECDDANNTNGDGCSAVCTIEHTLETCLDDCEDDRVSCTAGCKWWQVGCFEDCWDEYFDCETDCANLYCGNCAIDSGEQCDDCNAINTDACLTTCRNASCGDGYVRSGSGVEECDDANSSNTDACLNTCISATCGDGYVQSGVEECDDANNTNGDGCSATCTIEHTLETCLDDCEDDRVSCRTGCKWWEEYCFEDCWDEYFDCETDCANLYCGNCAIDSGEQCDDCNAINTDACLTTCRNARCGDYYTWSGVEQCDDGNSSNTDACLTTCINASCGDGYLRSGSGVEECDDANSSNTDACLNTCISASCGDGYAWSGVEECDDANSSNIDACLNTCVSATCGDGYVLSGSGVEQCDDANSSNTDACLNTCVSATCGDGYVQSGVEECDDANNTNGDGCSAVCVLESCADQGGDICTVNEICPGTIIPAGDTNSCCNVACRLSTCDEAGGEICRDGERCSGGYFITTQDSRKCCIDGFCREISY